MGYSASCLVWDQPTEAGGLVEYPKTIAKTLDAPVFTQQVPETVDSFDIRPFSDRSLTDRLVAKTPLANKYKLAKYANWKAPHNFDCLITRGPKTIHTVQRLEQDHIHIADGSYRGLFLHKDAYESFHEKSDVIQFLLGWNRLLMRTVVQGSMHTVDTLVVNSEWTADVVKRLYNREADAIIYPPTDLSEISPEVSNNDVQAYFLYLGSIDQLHRTEEVIEAFNNLDEHLVVAGEGSWLSTAKARASDNIDFCGYVTGAEKRGLLADCEALVVPAQHSFGRVIIESLAAGRPVIAADHGYAPYVVDEGETGLLYEPGVKNLLTTVERFESYSWETDRITAAAVPYTLDEVQAQWRELIFG